MQWTLRKSAAVILFSLLITASSIGVKAHAIGDFCYWWNVGTQAPDSFGCLTTGTWSWQGAYDFSSQGEEDALEQATYLCDDLIYSCWAVCESQSYRQARADYYTDQTGGQCSYGYQCVEGFANLSCQQAQAGTFSCSCSSFNFCPPC